MCVGKERKSKCVAMTLRIVPGFEQPITMTEFVDVLGSVFMSLQSSIWVIQERKIFKVIRILLIILPAVSTFPFLKKYMVQNQMQRHTECVLFEPQMTIIGV